MVAAPMILFLMIAPVLLIWVGGFFANYPAGEIRPPKRHQFLGPGGPDDPFASDPFDD